MHVFSCTCVCVLAVQVLAIKDSRTIEMQKVTYVAIFWHMEWTAEQRLSLFFLCLSQCDSSGLHYLCPLQTLASYLQFHSILQGCLPSARQAAPIVWPSCLIAAPTPPLSVFSCVFARQLVSVKRQTETPTARGACLMESHSEERIANKQ